MEGIAVPLDQLFVVPDARPLIDAVPMPGGTVEEEQRVLKHLIAKMRRGDPLTDLDRQWFAYVCGCGAMPLRSLSL